MYLDLSLTPCALDYRQVFPVRFFSLGPSLGVVLAGDPRTAVVSLISSCLIVVSVCIWTFTDIMRAGL